MPTAKGQPRQITDKYRHLKDIQISQLNNLNIGALLVCDMYVLIIAREIGDESLSNTLPSKATLDGQSRYRIRILHQRMMSTFAKPVKTKTNNFLKTSKRGETWNHLVPDPTNNDDENALRKLADTCRKTDEGRYDTGLLWKSTAELTNYASKSHLRRKPYSDVTEENRRRLRSSTSAQKRNTERFGQRIHQGN